MVKGSGSLNGIVLPEVVAGRGSCNLEEVDEWLVEDGNREGRVTQKGGL